MSDGGKDIPVELTSRSVRDDEPDLKLRELWEAEVSTCKPVRGRISPKAKNDMVFSGKSLS